MSENAKDRRFMLDAVEAAKNKAYEHREYSIRLDDPNDISSPALERLRRGEPGFFTEEEVSLFHDTVHDHSFELGALRGAEEMLDCVLERLGVESLEEAESYVRKGKEVGS